MNELIHIEQTQIGAENVNSVNARKIYKYLELADGQFSRWIKLCIEKYDFIKDVDYITLDMKVGATSYYDYIVSMDMAKELCMVSDSEKGKETRKYFIGIEKQSKAPQQFKLPQNYVEALEALTIAEKEKIVLSNRIEEKDKVILAVADLNIKAGDVSIGDFSKNLAIEGLGQNNLFSWLKGRGFLMINTAPYQQYVERGYFVRKPSNKRIHGEVRYTTLLTPKGTVWLTKMLKAEYDLD